MFSRANGREAGPTLLAPAGSPQAAEAALEAGADALYAGLKGWSRYGARSELDPGELRACLVLAHARGRRVQVAMNIIPKLREIPGLLRQVDEVHGWGADGLISNDYGLLRAIARRHPDLPLYASVGCGALNDADVAFLGDLGAVTVVLPGTLEPAEFAAIAARVRVGLEVFLHGVDEFVQLGKCWMPSYLKQREVNRVDGVEAIAGSVKRGGVGMCFRICHEPWNLAVNGRPLAPVLLPDRPYSLGDRLPEYLRAGVSVFKIKGRDLPAALVGRLVRGYRQALDRALEGLPAALEVR